MKKILFIQIFSILFLSNNAFAYFDPGTGSFILQILAVAIASVATFFKFYYQKTKEIIKKIKLFFSQNYSKK